MLLYALKNEITGYWNRPMFFENEAECKSTIINNIASDPSKALLSLSNDLSLYFIGEYDSTTGSIRGAKKPIIVSNVFDLIKDIKFKEVIIKDVEN